MDDPEAHLFGDPLAELGRDPFDQPLIVVAVHEPVAELLPPPFELALDVAVPASQVAQPDVIGIDRVERRQRVGEVVADLGPGRLVERRRDLLRACLLYTSRCV